MALTVRRGLFQPSTLWWLACSLLVIVFLPYAHWFTPDLSSLPQYRIDWSRVAVTPPPPGVPEDLVAEVRAAAELPDELRLLERGLAERLARAFAAHPWIRRVTRVEVQRQRRIEIDVVYRQVAVLVETSRGYYPVDESAVLLPPGDFTPADVARLPVVRNIKSAPQGAPGEAWGDLMVECAAKLGSALAPGGDADKHWKRMGLAAIVAPTPRVADYTAEDLSFEIVTRGGSTILWGRPPGGDALEPNVEEKLSRLDQVIHSQGSLDGPAGPYRIDIRHDVISLQPLADRRVR